MDCLDCITKIRKGQHLSYEERVIIELRLKKSWNVNKIAKELNRSYNSIKKEIKKAIKTTLGAIQCVMHNA